MQSYKFDSVSGIAVCSTTVALLSAPRHTQTMLLLVCIMIDGVICLAVFRGLESGLKCSDLLTKFTGLSADEEANR